LNKRFHRVIQIRNFIGQLSAGSGQSSVNSGQ
jgi:hypothetical protein